MQVRVRGVGGGGCGHSAEHACSRAALTTQMFYWYLCKCSAINFNIDLQRQRNLYTVQICSLVSCWSLERSFPGSLFLVSVKMSKWFQSKWLPWVISLFNNHDNGSAFLIKRIPSAKMQNVKKWAALDLPVKCTAVHTQVMQHATGGAFKCTYTL